MESPENDKTVFRPSHKPWESIKPIPTFPPPPRPRANYEIIPKRSRLKLPASYSPLRLILGLEKTSSCQGSRFRNQVGDYAESGVESWRWRGLGRKKRVMMVVFGPHKGRNREIARRAAPGGWRSSPSLAARPPQISRSDCAPANWQKSMATNWPQQVKPRA